MTTAPPACASRPPPPPTRRVENRVPSSDANPYLAMAASLACGYLGLMHKLTPSEPVGRDGGGRKNSTCRWACWRRWGLFEETEELEEVFGRTFLDHLRGGETRRIRPHSCGVISPWEREFLLLNV